MIIITRRLLLLFAFVPVVSVAQPVFETTVALTGGIPSLSGGSVDKDGNFLALSEINDVFYLVKADTSGQVQWVKTFNYGSLNIGLYGPSLAVSGYRYAIGGYAIGTGTVSRDAVLLITDSTSVIQNQWRIDHSSGSNAIQNAISIPGGFLFSGRTSSGSGGGLYDCHLFKTDMNGNV